MSKFRSRWLALFGGVTLIALSMSTAFAGKPDGTNAGVQVSTYVHSFVGHVQDTDTETEDDTEATDETETTDETDTDTEVEVEDSASSDHGTCVAEVAQSEDVGGDNENHGGAVSEAATDICWQEAPADETDTEEPADESDTEVESNEDSGSDTEVESDEDSGSETEDAADSTAGSDHGKGHGDSHEDDSSDD
jgi:clumping factor A